MPNIKDGWSYEDWSNIEKLSNDLLTIASELNERIGSGGGNNQPDNLLSSALQAEAVLAQIKQIATKYY